MGQILALLKEDSSQYSLEICLYRKIVISRVCVIMVWDEEFTEAIRAYPAIYDKNSPAHKNSTMVNNARKKVIEEPIWKVWT